MQIKPIVMTALAVCWLGGCASAPPTGATDPATTAATEAAESTDSTTATATGETLTAQSGEPGSGVRYELKFRMDPNMVCSRDRRTGSHFERDYCRSAEQARAESDAARDFFLEAMRNSQ